MELHQILLKHIPSKEIKARLNNKQVKVNNEPVSSSKIDVDVIDEAWEELGNFVFRHIDKIPNCFNFIDIKDFFGEGETNIEAVSFLSDFTLVSISKIEHFVFKRLPKTF